MVLRTQNVNRASAAKPATMEPFPQPDMTPPNHRADDPTVEVALVVVDATPDDAFVSIPSPEFSRG